MMSLCSYGGSYIRSHCMQSLIWRTLKGHPLTRASDQECGLQMFAQCRNARTSLALSLCFFCKSDRQVLSRLQQTTLIVMSLLAMDVAALSVQAVDAYSRNTNTSQSSAEGVYSLADVARHCTPADCWIIIRDKVYDVTDWVPKHPGGALIYINAGKDCTQLFDSYHPLYVK